MVAIKYLMIIVVTYFGFADGSDNNLEPVHSNNLERTLVNLAQSLMSYLSDQCRTLGPRYKKARALEVTPDKIHYALIGANSSFARYVSSAAAENIAAHPAFDVSAATYIYIPGWKDERSLMGGDRPRIYDGLRRRAHNVLVMDNAPLLNQLNLPWVLGLSAPIGAHLAHFLAQMRAKGMRAESVHLLGHSMGGQIAGAAARAYRARFGRKVARITALDLNSLCLTPEDSLTGDDAERVDVIYTMTGIVRAEPPAGRSATYFANGNGATLAQPPCSTQPIIDSLFCSHLIAETLYAESLENEAAFAARRCTDATLRDCDSDDGVAYAGYASPPDATGVYAFDTNLRAPYGMGAAGLRRFDHERQRVGRS